MREFSQLRNCLGEIVLHVVKPQRMLPWLCIFLSLSVSKLSPKCFVFFFTSHKR